MKTHDELWAENMALLTPTTMTQMDKDYVCGIMVRKDALYQFAKEHFLDGDQKGLADAVIEKISMDGVAK